MRRCIGCQTSFPQDELMRFTLVDGTITPDEVSRRRANKNTLEENKSSGHEGRGFYLCRSRECLDKAIKKRAFNRICRRNVDANEIVFVVEELLNDTKED